MSELDAFARDLGFPLDDFQLEACAAVERGMGVLVAAPTGAGKTVVGEFAVHLALATGRKAFYTTPIKALSNQKYLDLARRHGFERVGLLTGDSSINGEAPVVVMTTEVLRNMMYAGSPTLAGLGFVVMDEVHYLADRFRGAVWEEVIIHLPPDVQVVSLSATVSNAEEFGDWLAAVRGDMHVVVSEHRPVPLWQHMMVGRSLFDLFAGDTGPHPGAYRVNPALLQRIRNIQSRSLDHAFGRRDRQRQRIAGPRGGGPGRGGGRGMLPARGDVLDALDQQGLLPAITFVFSRNGCDAAVGQLLARGVRLITPEEGEANRRTVEERIAGLADEDLGVLGYWDLVDGLSRGFAAHHAGMLPTFREVVEELFTAGRIKAVFATETLALGINMPARSVVLERLVKFNGDTHAELTPAEYTQLTGRAGRRGIDIEGHAVVLWSEGVDPAVVAGLASTRTYPLRSSFRPTANMAVNLVDQVGRSRAREVLQTSFAQFQADRSVVAQARSLQRHEGELEALRDEFACHLGDFAEYAALRERLRSVEKGARSARAAAAKEAIGESLGRLRIGDVIELTRGRRAGYAVVVLPDTARAGQTPAPAVVTEDRHFHRVSLADLTAPARVVTTVRVARGFNGRNPKARRDLATTLRIAVSRGFPPQESEEKASGLGDATEVARIREQLRRHPCHGCPDREEHAAIAARWWRQRRQTDALAQRVHGQTQTVARAFDRICDLLSELGYLSDGGERVTARGQVLRRIYTEKDLLVAECLREEIWSRLDAPGLAACVSALVHEPRRDEEGGEPRVPTADVGEALQQMHRIWLRLEGAMEARGITPLGPPQPGIAWMIHRWASGQRLELVLRGSDLAAGDFVRRCKQVVDLLGQIEDVAEHPALARKARQARDGVLRGVVAADRVD